MVPALLGLIGLIGCLERVTGENVPLDPRFLRDGSDDAAGGGGGGGGTPGDGGGGGGGAGPSEVPYSDHDGEKVAVTGVAKSEIEGPIQIDVAEPDAAAPGGQRRVGVVHLAGPGPFSFEVPIDVASVAIQAFQDPDADGPTDKDPFAAATIKVGGAAPTALDLVLVAGARGQPNGGGGAPQGGPVGPGGGSGQPTAPPDGLSFPPGTTVDVTVRVLGTPNGTMVVDFFKKDPAARGGRNFLGRRSMSGPEVVVPFPEGYGEIEVEAYVDTTGDGRSGDDVVIRYERGPIIVTEDAPAPIELTVPAG